jgi:6-pyruvoyltetrahydropterin/6-carboxytetrahydropterin synthase
MRNNKTIITKTFEFSASHRYWRDDWSKEKNEQIFGICTSPYGHGHNYELHVTVHGEVDSQTGMIINLSDLKKMVNQVIVQFDHKFLNVDTPFFKDKIPTTENLALILFDLLFEELSGHGNFVLYKIRLYEKNDLYVDVWRDDS